MMTIDNNNKLFCLMRKQAIYRHNEPMYVNEEVRCKLKTRINVAMPTDRGFSLRVRIKYGRKKAETSFSSVCPSSQSNKPVWCCHARADNDFVHCDYIFVWQDAPRHLRAPIFCTIRGL